MKYVMLVNSIKRNQCLDYKTLRKSEGQPKIETFSSNDLFICKSFTSVFPKNTHSTQILLTCHSYQIIKLQQVGIDQSQKKAFRFDLQQTLEFYKNS